MLQKIRHLDFLPINFFEFEDILIKHGKLNTNQVSIERKYFKYSFENPQLVNNLNGIKKGEYNIVEMGNAFMISKLKPNLQQIEKNEIEPLKTHNVNTISILNYDEFKNDFDFESLYLLFYKKLNSYSNETLDDVKRAIYESNTEISAKILIEEVWTKVIKSEIFFNNIKSNDITEFVFFGKNSIQVDLYEHLEKHVNEIQSKLRQMFRFYLKDDDPIIIKEIEINETHKNTTREEKLRASNIYKIASLFADGTIIFHNASAQYKNKTYYNINSLAEEVSIEVLKLSKNSIQPYLNQTIKEIDTDKNVFTFSKIQYLELIASDFKKLNKSLSPFFIDKLQFLLSNKPH